MPSWIEIIKNLSRNRRIASAMRRMVHQRSPELPYGVNEQGERITMEAIAKQRAFNKRYPTSLQRKTSLLDNDLKDTRRQIVLRDHELLFDPVNNTMLQDWQPKTPYFNESPRVRLNKGKAIDTYLYDINSVINGGVPSSNLELMQEGYRLNPYARRMIMLSPEYQNFKK